MSKSKALFQIFTRALMDYSRAEDATFVVTFRLPDNSLMIMQRGAATTRNVPVRRTADND